MFCSKCGTDLPSDLRFCRKCGHALNATNPTSVTSTGAAAAPALAPRERKLRIAIWFLVPLLLLIIWWAAWSVSNRTNQNDSTKPFLQQLAVQPHVETLTNSAFTVKASGYVYFKFEVPPAASDVTVTGHFSATGGSGNDVEVYVLTEDGFVNFQNGHSSNTYYNSGKVTQSSVNAALPPSAGTYYLVFNNGFSLLTPKAIQASVMLRYSR